MKFALNNNTPNLIKYEEKKGKIFEALSDVIYTKGIAKLTVRQLTKYANVNVATVHYYFKSKEKLLDEFLNCICERILNDIEMVKKSHDPPEQKLHHLFELAKKSIENKKQRKWFMVFLNLWTFSMRDPHKQQTISNFYERLSSIICDIIDESQQKGKFIAVNKTWLSNSLIAFVEGMGVQWNLRKNRIDLKDHFNFFYRMVKKTLTPVQ